MKAITLLLVVSLLANGALVFGLIKARTSEKSPSASMPVGTNDAVVANLMPQGSPGSALTSSGKKAIVEGHTPPSTPTFWSRLQNEDLGEFKRKLKAAGFPSKEIYALLAAAISSRERMALEALIEKSDHTPYWKMSSRPIDPERQTKISALIREITTLGFQYLGTAEALADDEDQLAETKRHYGNLSVDKLQQMRALDWTADIKRREIWQNEPSDNSPEARKARSAALKSIEDEKLAAVTRLLAPEELEQYELRNSALAYGLRRSLEDFQPTEAEYKAIYAINRKMNSLNSTPASLPTDDSAVREQWTTHLQAALSPERYADYQAVANAGSDKLGKLIARLEMPPSTIAKVNSVRDDIMARAKTINNNDNLPTPERDAQFAALAAEASEKLTSTLGARGYEAYADIKGDWIRTLKKPQARGQ